MSVKAKARKAWSRREVRVAALTVALSAFGMALPVAVVWGALMLWHRDFRRMFNDWYMRSVMAGLAAAVLLSYPLSNMLNVPPVWVAAVFVAAGSFVALRGRI